jgi:hypothetical protein
VRYLFTPETEGKRNLVVPDEDAAAARALLQAYIRNNKALTAETEIVSD